MDVMTEWSTSTIETRAPDTLNPHPLNTEVYGDRTDFDQSFLDSVRNHGILEPVVVDTEDTIISGHRRVAAALEVGLDTIPVRVREFESELARREALVHHNRRRDKTFSQKMREAEALEEIERERAQARQGERTDLVENQPQGDGGGARPSPNFGKTRDKVGEEVGIGSGRTYTKAKQVWNAAQDGDTVAQHEVDRLDRDEQSIHGAYQKVKGRLTDAGTDDTTETDTNSETATGMGASDEGETEDETLDPDDVVLSAHRGTNEEVFPKVLDLHIEDGASVADVTYGEGAFWRQVPAKKYDLTATDIDPSRSPDSTDGVDCRDLPYEDASFDCIVLDPPYAEGFYETEGKPSDNDYWIEKRYASDRSDNAKTYHEAVLQMYAAAGREADRVLRDEGVLIAKMQDEVSRNEQRLTHVEVTNMYEEMGFTAEDLFVVVRPDTPTVGRVYEQRRARKNHSYFIVYR